MQISRLSQLCLMLAMAAFLQACASSTTVPHTNFDFGAPPARLAQSAAKLALTVGEIGAPATFDGNAMLYRLDYDNPQQLRPYAQHRWSMPPAQLFAQRLKLQIAASGGTVLAASDGVADLPVLKIELDEFSQIFSSPTQSHAQLSLRASLVKKNTLIAQRQFSLTQPAASPDAPAGARAMQTATDASIAAVIAWLQGLPPH